MVNANAAAGYVAPVTQNSTNSKNGSGTSWYEAMAQAWGAALDQQASVIQTLSDEVNKSGQDQPSVMVQLTAQAQKMGFLANSASTSNNSVGEALQTLGKKQ
jgi:molybdopterin-biosynthesis enzyme MoeA-like protein